MDRKLPLTTVHPITNAELVELRELLFGTHEGVVAQREAMSAAVGLVPVTLWRMEQPGGAITHGVMLRRALVNVADEMAIHIPKRLRFGEADKPKARSKAAGKGR